MPIDRSFISEGKLKGGAFLNTTESTNLREGTTEQFFGQGNEHHRYPANVGQRPYEKWILFEARSGRHILRDQILGEGGSNKDDTLASVALYLPESALKTSTAVTFDSAAQLGAAGVVLEGGLAAIKAGKDSPIDHLTKAVTGSSWNINEFVTGLKGLIEPAKAVVGTLVEVGKTKLAGAVQAGAEALITGGKDALELTFGKTINPRTDTLFRNVEYRHHSLDFLLVPRSEAEAIVIDSIVSFFSFYMLPSYGGAPDGSYTSTFLIGYPYEFEIRMFSEFNELTDHHVNSIGRSVLRSISIDNSSESKVAFIEKDGGYYPASTRLSLEFQEIRLLGRDSSEIVRGGVQNFRDPRLQK